MVESAPSTSAARLSKIFWQLEDFAAPPPKPKPVVVEPVEEVEAAELEPERISMTQAEFDSHIEAARKDGAAQGQQVAESALHTQYEACMATLVNGLREENKQRYAVVERAADAFVQAVVQSVVQLTKIAPELLHGVQCDLVNEAAGFVQECEGSVTVVCGAADATLLRGILGEGKEVLIDVQDGIAAGTLHIVTAENSILLDAQQWQNSVVEKLVKTVKALSQQGIAKKKVGG
ncbi:hypothetical protein AD953_03905 [Acetobacter malorum]|uniref:Flagellar assembly protein FliH/Type III secretion system HrpE domain-containing protein n=1 Tax=Acetobacter malorum TaxID=178901 RepID=A0A149VFI0_9PROT|nr:hypothetical protein [Acetobacter malorum]KXV78703.1 hypothetical protein AD953_03905 [Acetobacter malorum]